MSKVELINDYIAECAPLLDTIVESIFALKLEPENKAHLDKIFRAFHTIKSNSSIIDRIELGELCHVAEDALAKVRDTGMEVSNSFISAIMLVIDYLNDSFSRLDADLDLNPLDSSILFKLAAIIEE